MIFSSKARWITLFTGIVEEIGIIRKITKGNHSAVLMIEADRVLENTKIGDSIAVNGICLTVTHLLSRCFFADVMHETLNRSSLAQLTAGASVNLERAMAAGGRFGGHIVTGHTDGIGTIREICQDDTAVWFTIQTAPEILRYIVEKGSVTIDGISLTVASVRPDRFSVSVIPHTICQTSLHCRCCGDTVNLEADIIGKYIEKLCQPARQQQKSSSITREFLSHYGF